jgi:hypothetical protein
MAIKLAFALRAGHPENLRHDASWYQRNKIRNPNIEIRNKYEKLNPNYEIRNGFVWNFLIFDHLKLFRISDFEFFVFSLWRDISSFAFAQGEPLRLIFSRHSDVHPHLNLPPSRGKRQEGAFAHLSYSM